MRIWIDVYNPTGTRIGQPVVNVISASITRALDGGGKFVIVVPATDSRAATLLDNENRVKIWYWDGTQKRQLGSGVIDTVNITASEGGFQMNVSGPDSLDELTRYNTLRNYQFSEQAVENVIAGLALEAGWDVSVVGGTTSTLVTARYDGTNILKACIETVKGQGVHFRESATTERMLEVGLFGEDSGVVLISPSALHDDLLRNDRVAIITRLNLVRKTNTVYNWILPLGSGEGVAALTLEKSTRGTPYIIQTMAGRDGKTLYYLKDEASIARYGEIRKTAVFKQISPISNSATAITLAANAMYDAAASELSRNSVRQDTYSVSCRKMKTTIRPGDKIWVRYKGMVFIDGVPVTPLDVNEQFWVLKATEKVSESGATLDLEISNVDKMAESVESVIVGTLDSVNVSNLKPVTGISAFTSPQTDTCDFGYKDALFYLELQDFVTDVVKVMFTFSTRPLYTTAIVTQSGTWAPQYYPRILTSPVYPKNIGIEINGVDVTADFAAQGAPWNSSNLNSLVNVSLDITQYVVDNGIHNKTTVKIKPGTAPMETAQYSGYSGASAVFSQGYVDANFITLAIVQAIEPA